MTEQLEWLHRVGLLRRFPGWPGSARQVTEEASAAAI
jgi:hypothetical protein